MPENLFKILCVDDEANILSGLSRQLRGKFDVHTAVGGAAALELFKEKGPFNIVISDMRMPEMDGATFLGKIRSLHPDSVRILLTGQTDMNSAIAAVNEGYIFRFLTKPCEPEKLLRALEAAKEQHRLLTAEKVLLEQTLQGSIQTLVDLLSLASPELFSMGTRLQSSLHSLLNKLQLSEKWPIEVAAMLSQVGALTLPEESIHKLSKGETLKPEEEVLLNKLPGISEKLLSHIPRLEPVREILLYQEKHFDGTGYPNDLKRGEEIPLGARILKVLLDYHRLSSKSYEDKYIFDTLYGRKGFYDPEILKTFAELTGNTERNSEILELKVSELKTGMKLSEDLFNLKGVILVRSGIEITPALLLRLQNIAAQASGIREPIRVNKA